MYANEATKGAKRDVRIPITVSDEESKTYKRCSSRESCAVNLGIDGFVYWWNSIGGSEYW